MKENKRGPKPFTVDAERRVSENLKASLGAELLDLRGRLQEVTKRAREKSEWLEYELLREQIEEIERKLKKYQ